MAFQQTTWRIEGMYCPHCEAAIRRAVQGLDGIDGARADYRAGTLNAQWDSEALPERQIAERIAEAGYTLVPQGEGKRRQWLRLLAALAAVLFVFLLLTLTPIQSALSVFPAVRAGMGLGALFTLGLLTSLHCVGMCGGINLTQSALTAQRGGKVTRANALYNLGRVLSYTATGAVVGALGTALRFSTAAQAAIQLIAAVAMLVMALAMLGAVGHGGFVLPQGLRLRLLAHGANSSLYLGLLNGLMPCGPLQAMQLYALSAGSWWMGALSELCFSLGTVPLMLGFGLLGGRLNNRFAKPMRLVSGALILVMGTAMLSNSAALAGVRLPNLSERAADTAAAEDGVQLVRSELEWRSYPDITVKAGTPVRWVIHAEENRITGCNNEMVIPALGLRVPLHAGDNVVEFTVDEPGVIPYTCWMGMLRGSITVE